MLDELIDDRQGAINFAQSRHRNLNLKELREQGYEAEIDSRLEGIARRIADFLKKGFAATEIG